MINSTLNTKNGFTNHKVVFAHFNLPNIDSSRFFKQL